VEGDDGGAFQSVSNSNIVMPDAHVRAGPFPNAALGGIKVKIDLQNSKY
jgi:hypothetical protein